MIKKEDKERTLNIIGTALIVLALIIAVNAVYSNAQNATDGSPTGVTSVTTENPDEDREVEIVTDTGEQVDVPTMVTATESLIQSSSALIIAILGLAGLVVKYFGDRFMSKKDQERVLLGIQQGRTGLNKAMEEKALQRYILTEIYNRSDENKRKEVLPMIQATDASIEATGGQINYFEGEAERLFPKITGRTPDPGTIKTINFPREDADEYALYNQLAAKYARAGGDVNK